MGRFFAGNDCGIPEVFHGGGMIGNMTMIPCIYKAQRILLCGLRGTSGFATAYAFLLPFEASGAIRTEFHPSKSPTTLLTLLPPFESGRFSNSDPESRFRKRETCPAYEDRPEAYQCRSGTVAAPPGNIDHPDLSKPARHIRGRAYLCSRHRLFPEHTSHKGDSDRTESIF